MTKLHLSPAIPDVITQPCGAAPVDAAAEVQPAPEGISEDAHWPYREQDAPLTRQIIVVDGIRIGVFVGIRGATLDRICLQESTDQRGVLAGSHLDEWLEAGLVFER